MAVELGFQSFEFVLEAKISENGDYFKFPTQVNHGEGPKIITFQFVDSLGQGIPNVIENDGAQCKLTCSYLRNRPRN